MADVTDSRDAATRYLQPSVLLKNRLTQQQAAQNPPARSVGRGGAAHHDDPGSAANASDRRPRLGMMLDFTSALYLGLRHAHGELEPWPALTTGRPAAAGVPRHAAETAAELAKLMGCACGLLAPSTLHLFFDVFDVLAREPIAIFAERGLYPVMR